MIRIDIDGIVKKNIFLLIMRGSVIASFLIMILMFLIDLPSSIFYILKSNDIFTIRIISILHLGAIFIFIIII